MSADGGLKVGAFLQAARSVCRNRDPQGSSPCVDVASVSSSEEYIRLCTGRDQADSVQDPCCFLPAV